MKVIKRDGRIQDFDFNKIMLSVENASDNAEAPMTGSDLQHIGEDIREKIEYFGSDPIPSAKIYEYVYETLKNLGFSVVAEYYNKNKSM